ncbi:MAG: 50S ribosomal protein L25 [Patescibacteria group bacterium]
MEEFILNAKARTLVGRKNRELRDDGQVPAVVYGAGTAPTSISIDRNEFIKIYRRAGESTVLSLKINEKTGLPVLIQEFQKDPIKNTISHVDFRCIDMNKEIEATVDIVFVNEAPAVKALGGTLVVSREYVNIRCLPTKLVRNIQVDLSTLVTFEDSIRVENLVVPEGIVIEDEPRLSIVSVTPPRSEAEMASLDAAVEGDVSAVEVAAKKAEEGETPEAGADDAKKPAAPHGK